MLVCQNREFQKFPDGTFEKNKLQKEKNLYSLYTLYTDTGGIEADNETSENNPVKAKTSVKTVKEKEGGGYERLAATEK